MQGKKLKKQLTQTDAGSKKLSRMNFYEDAEIFQMGSNDGFAFDGYSVNANGTYYDNGDRVSRTPMVPCATLDYNGVFAMRIAYRSAFSNASKFVEVPLEAVTKHKKLLELSKYTIDVDSENSKDVSKYLKSTFYKYREELPRIMVTQSCGWIDWSFVPFDDDFEVSSKYKDIVDRCICQSGSVTKWCEAFSMVAENLIARIVIASACCAPLLDKLGIRENAIVNLVGASSNGKSIILQFAASVWGDFKNAAFFRCANATQFNIETTASLFCDLPVFLDEAETKSWVSHELMQWAQGYEKGRRNQIDVARFRNVFMLCSERSILPSEFNQGLLNRIFEVTFDEKIGSDDFITDFVSKFEKNFGLIGPLFIEEVQKLGADDTLMEIFEGLYSAVKIEAARLRVTLNVKIMRVLAALLTADQILNVVLSNIGCCCDTISIEGIINCYINSRAEDPDDKAFYEMCSSCRKNVVTNKKDIKLNPFAYFDGARECVYVDRYIADRYREHFVNWVAKNKAKKYGRSFYARILGRQFLTVTDPEAINFFKGI